ncbi:MAG: rhodanese-like domain-containing protein [Anaerolineae bacterium]|nr:rhodanese-like domain-containing protein [Anaerolineae bacterium]
MAKKPGSRRTIRKAGKQSSGAASYAIPIVVGVVMVTLVIGAVVLNENRLSGAAAVRPEEISVPVKTVEPQPTQSIPYPDVPRITLKETQSLLEKEQALLVDVRDSRTYDQSHAVGALSFPESEVEARLSELPRDKKLILYCT